MTNPYAPPGNFEEGDEPARRQVRRFYETTTTTIVILQIVSFGLYAVYWFYQHWAVQKRTRRLEIYPWARAFFAIFFVHRLFELIRNGARSSGMSRPWDARSQATLYVVLVLAARISGQIGSDQLAALVVSVGLTAASAMPLVAAQRVANLANRRVPRNHEREHESEHEEPGEGEEDD